MDGGALPRRGAVGAGTLMVLCSFQRAFYLNFWLTQFLLCVFWILLSSSFYGWGNGLKPLAQTHRANNQHQAGLKGEPMSLRPCTQSPSGERTGTSLPTRDLVETEGVCFCGRNYSEFTKSVCLSSWAHSYLHFQLLPLCMATELWSVARGQREVATSGLARDCFPCDSLPFLSSASRMSSPRVTRKLRIKGGAPPRPGLLYDRVPFPLERVTSPAQLTKTLLWQDTENLNIISPRGAWGCFLRTTRCCRIINYFVLFVF